MREYICENNMMMTTSIQVALDAKHLFSLAQLGSHPHLSQAPLSWAMEQEVHVRVFETVWHLPDYAIHH